MGPDCVAQAYFELLTLSTHYQSAGVTGVCHSAQPKQGYFKSCETLDRNSFLEELSILFHSVFFLVKI